MPISAAATTKTRNTSTAPAAAPVCSAKVTRLRTTPFSINSMHISITSRFRRMITPMRPRREERGAERDQEVDPIHAFLLDPLITASAATAAASSSTEVSSKCSQYSLRKASANCCRPKPERPAGSDDDGAPYQTPIASSSRNSSPAARPGAEHPREAVLEATGRARRAA